MKTSATYNVGSRRRISRFAPLFISAPFSEGQGGIKTFCRFAFRLFVFALISLMFLPSAFAHDQIPGANQTRPIALVNGTIHPVSGEPFIGTLIFSFGCITGIGADVTPTANVETIDCTGKHIYPGFIDPHTAMGLAEIDQARATRDYAEVGEVNPNAQAQKAFFSDSERIPVTRSNGTLTVLTTPSEGIVSGQAALMSLDGWMWEDMTVKAPAAMALQWPTMSQTSSRRGRRNPEDVKKQSAEKLAKIRLIFEQARAYDKAKSSPDSARHLTDSRWEALRPVLRGELPLLVSADELLQIQSAVQFATENGFKMMIYGGYDAPLCADLLKKFDIPVIVSGTHRLPLRKDDAYDTPFTVPARLAAAGVKFAISDNSDSWNARNLPYSAGMAAAYGLDKSAALRAITLTPAEIYGVSDKLGSLELGKHATLFVANGDPLEIPTQIERAWIQGRAVDLKNRQTMLNDKYMEKLNR